MIRETATVTAADGQYVWVQTQRQSACESCSAQKGCGTSAIGKVVGKQYTQVRALNRCNAKIGDSVEVALAEDMLLKSSLAVYLVPLLLFIAGGALAEPYSTPAHQWPVLLGSFVGLGFGFAWLKFYSRLLAANSRFQPVVETVLQSGNFNINTVYTP